MHGIRKIIILIAAAVFLASVGFMLFDIVKNSVLLIHNIHWKIRVTAEIYIDFYGAVIPTAFSLFIVFYLVYFKEFSIKQYVHYFLLSIVLALVCSDIRSTAIVTFYKLLAISISFLAVFMAFYDGGLLKFLKSRDFCRLDFTKRNYVTALLIAFSYASLSVLIVDLAYLPFAISMYIGAMGLTDGIMLSGLFTPLSVTLASLFVMFLYEMTCIANSARKM